MSDLARLEPRPVLPADARPATTPIRIFEFDPRAPTSRGVNPKQIMTDAIGFEHRIPRREAAARERVQALTGRPASLSHATDGAVIATVYVAGSHTR